MLVKRGHVVRCESTLIAVNVFQDLADILYRAAEDGSHADPQKVEQILGVPRTGSRRETARDVTISGAFLNYCF